MRITRYINTLMMIWIVYYTYDLNDFTNKLNSLPKEVVDNSQMKFKRTSYLHLYYIIYWEEESKKL